MGEAGQMFSANSLKRLAPRDWARTSDLTVNSRPLYQLSYRGMLTRYAERWTYSYSVKIEGN
jgi:hypothetical protein